MEDFLSYIKNKRNLGNLIALLILLIGLPVALGLVRQQQILRSRAAGEVNFVESTDPDTNNCVRKGSDGKLFSICSKVSIKLTSSLGPPAGSTQSCTSDNDCSDGKKCVSNYCVSVTGNTCDPDDSDELIKSRWKFLPSESKCDKNNPSAKYQCKYTDKKGKEKTKEKNIKGDCPTSSPTPTPPGGGTCDPKEFDKTKWSLTEPGECKNGNQSDEYSCTYNDNGKTKTKKHKYRFDCSTASPSPTPPAGSIKCDPKVKDKNTIKNTWSIKSDTCSNNKRKVTFTCPKDSKKPGKLKKKSIKIDDDKCDTPFKRDADVGSGDADEEPDEDQEAFNGPHNIPGKIEAEDFDTGGEGVAYHDTDKADRDNKIRNFRSTELVDIYNDVSTNDTDSSKHIGLIRSGEWLEYTVNVVTAGNYKADLRYFPDKKTDSSIHIELDGQNISGPINITGNKKTEWQTISKTGLSLTTGEHIIRIVFDIADDKNFANGGYFNYIEFTPTSTTSLLDKLNNLLSLIPFEINLGGVIEPVYAGHITDSCANTNTCNNCQATNDCGARTGNSYCDPNNGNPRKCYDVKGGGHECTQEACDSGGSCKPEKPNGLSPSGTVDPGNVALKWNSVSGADKYAIRIDDQQTGETNSWGDCDNLKSGDKCEEITGTSYNFTFQAGHQYDWWVHAIKNSCGDWSDDTKVHVNVSGTSAGSCPPAAPQNLTPSGDIQPGSKTLKWNAVPGATKYSIRIDDQHDGESNSWSNDCNNLNEDDICNDNVTSNEFNFEFEAGHEYDWWVHAINNNCSTAFGQDTKVHVKVAEDDDNGGGDDKGKDGGGGGGKNKTPKPTPTPTPVPQGVTFTYRVAANTEALKTAADIPYTTEPTIKPDVVLDPGIGDRSVFVQFNGLSPAGQPAVATISATIKVVASPPNVAETEISCQPSLTGSGITVRLIGKNFGNDKGTLQTKGEGNTSFTIADWNDTAVTASADLPGESDHNGKQIVVVLTRPDGVILEKPCTIGSKVGFDLGAKLFCRTNLGQQDTDDVEVEILEKAPGAKPIVIKDATITKEGLLQGQGIDDLNFTENQQYIISVLAPKSVRRNSLPFTTPLEGFTKKLTLRENSKQPNDYNKLPIGNIAPLNDQDDNIDNADKFELIHEFGLTSNQGSLPADFNSDGQVNSLDWACMRYDLPSTGDSLPTQADFGGSNPTAGSSSTPAATSAPNEAE